MRYYISGPMKGYPNSNYDTFDKVCKHLRSLDLDVYSPHEVKIIHTSNPSYEDYMKADIALLTSCNAIIMMPGWVYSKGAMVELQVAMALKFRVFFYNSVAELKSHVLLEMGELPPNE